jgi:hypothetical protein
VSEEEQGQAKHIEWVPEEEE